MGSVGGSRNAPLTGTVVTATINDIVCTAISPRSGNVENVMITEMVTKWSGFWDVWKEFGKGLAFQLEAWSWIGGP